MNLDHEAVRRIIEGARHRDEGVLVESEGMGLIEAAGIPVPLQREVPGAAAMAEIGQPPIPGEKVVVKVVSPRIPHKTEEGGVAVVSNDCRSVLRAVAEMEKRLAGKPIDGFLLQEFIPHECSFGNELLLGMRWTTDFGPVITVGAGGVHTEFLARTLQPGHALALLFPSLSGGDVVERALSDVAAVRLMTQEQRGQTARADLGELAAIVRRFLALAESFMPVPIGEFEINPLVLSGRRFVALDALFKFGGQPPAPSSPRPLAKLKHLLEPRSVAVMGVSQKRNPGRIILENLLENGFPRGKISVVKPGAKMLDGCRCYPSIADLPRRVDLMILSVSAVQAPEAVTALVESRRAETVILIPGGLDEKPENVPLVEKMQAAVTGSRETDWRGPVINGGNCLGIRSVPGRYNTLFIPEYKFPLPRGEADPVALISGSGAFVVSKGSKMAGVNPRYIVSIGNQIDLTLGDYLEYLKDDPEIEIFAVYTEGFRPLDGLRFFQMAEKITASGRTVILYRAGRTEAGAAAAASHTAAVAGDYEVTRRLAKTAGVVLAETLEDFEDLLRVFALLRDRTVGGWRLGAVSNAGYECVAIADNLGALELAEFSASTRASLGDALSRSRLTEIVTVRNPIDLTPIMGDEGYEQVIRSVLLDPGVDVALIGCVPLTGALNTLAEGEGHGDDVNREGSLASRMRSLCQATDKAWVAVVDAGSRYDAMVRRLEDGGIPVFRTADRALRLFNVFCRERMKKKSAVEVT